MFTTQKEIMLFLFLFFFWSVLMVLCCFVWAFSSRGAWGLLFMVMCVLLTVETSLVAEHRL